jgi:hypothetical protein
MSSIFFNDPVAPTSQTYSMYFSTWVPKPD